MERRAALDRRGIGVMAWEQQEIKRAASRLAKAKRQLGLQQLMAKNIEKWAEKSRHGLQAGFTRVR